METGMMAAFIITLMAGAAALTYSLLRAEKQQNIEVRCVSNPYD